MTERGGWSVVRDSLKFEEGWHFLFHPFIMEEKLK